MYFHFVVLFQYRHLLRTPESGVVCAVCLKKLFLAMPVEKKKKNYVPQMVCFCTKHSCLLSALKRKKMRDF